MSADRCRICGMIISVQPLSLTTKAVVWGCKTCGAIYFGGAEEEDESHGVLPIDTTDANQCIAPVAAARESSPANVECLIASLASSEETVSDRRRHQRHPVVIPLIAVPLGRDFQMAADPFPLATANLSLGGASLIHRQPVDAPYLVLDFTVAGGELLQVVLKVIRVRRVGPIYEIAGEFIDQLVLHGQT